MKTEEENVEQKSDIQKDMDILSEVRDELFDVLMDSKTKADKIALADMITKVINSRQNSELLQLRIWGLLDAHEEHDENCPECNPAVGPGSVDSN